MMDSEELIPGLPRDVALQCLIRVSHEAHSEIRHVCRGWRSLIGSADFYAARQRSELTSPSICLVQAAAPEASSDGASSTKQGTVPRFHLNLYDFQLRSWCRLPPIPDYDAIPLFCQIVGVAGKIFVIGGWNPSTYQATRSVFWFDFSQKIWRRAADMSTARSFFAAGAVGGKIYVAGGHDENKNALRTCERLDIDRNVWEPMPDLAQERDECRGIITGGRKFSVFSGYRTDSQGEFSSSCEILSESGDSWETVEDFISDSTGEGRIVCGGSSGAVYRVRENGEVLRVGSCGCSCPCSCGKIRAVPLTGKIVAACSGSGRMGQEIVVMVEENGGVCKGVGLRPGLKKDSWEILADGGEADFRGVVQAACLVDI